MPALASPEMLLCIEDICQTPDWASAAGSAEANGDLQPYQVIRHWNSLGELTYQVLLANNVITLGSSETELARFPGEVRKARLVADAIAAARRPAIAAAVARAAGDR